MTETSVSPVCTISDCARAVSAAFGVNNQRLRGGQRSWDVSHPRFAAMWLAWHEAGRGLSDISRYFRKDRKTAWHGIRRVESIAAKNPDFEDMLQDAWLRLYRVQFPQSSL